MMSEEGEDQMMSEEGEIDYDDEHGSIQDDKSSEEEKPPKKKSGKEKDGRSKDKGVIVPFGEYGDEDCYGDEDMGPDDYDSEDLERIVLANQKKLKKQPEKLLTKS